jgi:hypothetical protein
MFPSGKIGGARGDDKVLGEERTMRRLLAIAASLSLFSTTGPAAWAGIKGKDQLILYTENQKLEKAKGIVKVDGEKKQIQFDSDAGQLVVPCSAVTDITYTKNSKELKKAVAAEIAAAPFTLGLSLIGLAFKSHGNFMLLAYGDHQQAAFRLDNDTYALRLQAASSCTGKPIQTLSK